MTDQQTAAYLEFVASCGIDNLFVPARKKKESGGAGCVVESQASGTKDPNSLARLGELETATLSCQACALAKTRNKVVFGSGNTSARLMLVGEAPGADEDIQGVPFVGRAGQLLTKILQAIGLEREDVYIANVLKCRPPNNRNPQAEEIIACRDILFEQIRLIRPEVILALGSFAAQVLLDCEQSVGSMRSNVYDFAGCEGTKLVVTYHPAYLLRNPGAKRNTWEDVKCVRRLLDGQDG